MGAILIMVAKGMRPRDIAAVFPEITLDEIRESVLQAAELMNDPEGSLAPSAPSVQAILDKARLTADLSEDEAMARAVELTEACRREKSSR